MENKIDSPNIEIERTKIDQLDREIVCLLDRRFELVKTIAKIKMNHGIPIFQAGREQQVLERVANISKNSDSCIEIFKKIMLESKRLQEELICK